MDISHRFFPELRGLKPTFEAQYYEAAWAMRSDVIESWIAAGETSLPRLLSRFQAYENRYALRTEVEDGVLSGWFCWYPIAKDWQWRGLDRLETQKQGVIRGQNIETFDYIQFDIERMLADFTDDVDTIVEIGSGYGRRLFNLYHHGAQAGARYVGAEVTQAGRKLAARLAQLEPGIRFDSQPFDFNDPDWSFLEGSRNALIFSVWALMIPPLLPDDFFDKIARLPGTVTMVFCEPLGYQWGITHPLSGNQLATAASDGMNRNLKLLADDAVKRGLIEPLAVITDAFSHDNDHPLNLVSVMIYRKAG